MRSCGRIQPQGRQVHQRDLKRWGPWFQVRNHALQLLSVKLVLVKMKKTCSFGATEQAEMQSVATNWWTQGRRRGERHSQGGRNYMGLVTLFFISVSRSECPRGLAWKSFLENSTFQGWVCCGNWEEASNVNTRLIPCFRHWCIKWRSLFKSISLRFSLRLRF